MSTPLFVNEFGSQQAGFDGEVKRRDESRLQKRKALQELADQAASQGKQLDTEAWFQMAQDTIGADALYGDAPSSAILEGIRSNSNLKAQQVAQQRKFEEAQRGFQTEDQLRSRVGEMARSGSSETDIYENVRDLYGDDFAKKFKPRLGTFMSQATIADERDGMQLGSVYQSTEEAEQRIQQQPGMSEPMQRGIRNAAKLNEQRNDASIAQVGNTLAANGGFADDASTRQWVLRQLPPAMQGSPRAQEYVQRVMDSAKGGSGIVSRQQSNSIDQSYKGAFAQNAPGIAGNYATFAVNEQAALEKRVSEAQRNVQQYAADKVNKAIAPFGDISKIKDKEKQGLAADATEFLRTYDLPEDMQTAIVSAAARGDANALAVAKQAAVKVGVPMAEMLDATKKTELFKAGRISGSPEQMFNQVAFVSQPADDRLMAARGQALLQLYTRDPRDSAGLMRREADNVVQMVVNATLGTRETLLQSGVFGADAQHISQMEKAAIMRQLKPLADASKIPPEALLANVMAKLPPPQAINPRRSPLDIYGNAVEGGFRAIGQQPPGAPANQWWRQR